MKKLLFSVLFLFILLISCTQKPKPEITEQLKSALRSDAKTFMESLKSVLIKEIQTHGIVSAVSVCSDTAQVLTNNYGISKGIYIKRVSFKNRNPLNVPDDFEAQGLKLFEDLHNKNLIKPETEYVEIIEENGVSKVRYMKPIFVQPECLSCHGTEEQISPQVKEVINKIYPDDKAKGYKMGDLRGAVSIQKTL
ncbi:MAG: Tll0287-like domain-containing protein [Ignavibacterium sp.]